jgi:(S)-ureidoglycine-glyoxylate aminotransferase
VLRAMSADMLGQFDPEMTGYMNQVMALYRPVFGTANAWTMLVDGTARAGIEAALVSLIAPGRPRWWSISGALACCCRRF